MKTLSTFVVALSLAVLSSTAMAWSYNAAPSSPTEYYGNWRYHSEQYSPFNFWVKTCHFERVISSVPTNGNAGHAYVGNPPSNNSVSGYYTSRTDYKSITVSRAFNCQNARP